MLEKRRWCLYILYIFTYLFTFDDFNLGFTYYKVLLIWWNYPMYVCHSSYFLSLSNGNIQSLWVKGAGAMLQKSLFWLLNIHERRHVMHVLTLLLLVFLLAAPQTSRTINLMWILATWYKSWRSALPFCLMSIQSQCAEAQSPHTEKNQLSTPNQGQIKPWKTILYLLFE